MAKNKPPQRPILWPERFEENPKGQDESWRQYARRLSELYECSVGNVRSKIDYHFKKSKVGLENEGVIAEVIDKTGIDPSQVHSGWLKTTEKDKNGNKHSIYYKVEHEENFMENLVNALQGYQFSTPKISKLKKAENVGIINIFDAHIDKLCIPDQTNVQSSLQANIDYFKTYFSRLLDRSIKDDIERLIFPIGNDFFNANDEKNTTVKGTPQDSFFDWKGAFSEGLSLIRWCVDYALSKGLPVDLITVYSNHDATKLFYLSKCIEIVYEGNKSVTIDLQSVQRKYYVFGECMFGFAHGDKEKTTALPTLMSIEKKKEWADTSHRYWFLGDKHHGKEFMLKKSLDTPAVEIHWLRAVATTDRWHNHEGYIGIPKTAYCYVFNKIKGLTATYRETF